MLNDLHHCIDRQQSNDSPNDNKDISIDEFANFHREMIDNSTEKIKEEYKAIQAFSDSLDKTSIASVANEKLNRYSNIFPFDYNRVVLNYDEFENDYINASYINVRSITCLKFKPPAELLICFQTGLPLPERVHRRAGSKSKHGPRFLAHGASGQSRVDCYAYIAD